MKVLLFTGGLDSTALAYSIRPDLSITIDYGQLPAPGEIRAAAAIARELSLRHEVIRVDAREIGSGLLNGEKEASPDMPPEWWPYRNQLLITLAAARIAKEGGGTILIGTVSSDRVHCDGQPDFVKTIDELLNLQRPYSRLEAPAIDMTAVDLIRSTGVPQELLGWTFSCHASDVACGRCRGCHKHAETLHLAFH